MNTTKHENHSAVAGQVDCRVRPHAEAYARWLAGTHAPALRRMDSEGAHAAGWHAGVDLCAARLEQAAAEYMASATKNKYLTDHGRVLMTSAADWAETMAKALRALGPNKD